MEEGAYDVRQNTECTEHADQGSPSTDLNQVHLHEGIPRRGEVRIHNGGDTIRYVIDWQEIVNDHRRPPEILESSSQRPVPQVAGAQPSRDVRNRKKPYMGLFARTDEHLWR